MPEDDPHQASTAASPPPAGHAKRGAGSGPRPSRRGPHVGVGGRNGPVSVVPVMTDADRAREMVISLLARKHPAIEAAQAEALQCEEDAVKAIEVGMVSRQDSAQVKDVLEKARAAQTEAEAKAKETEEAATKAQRESEAAAKQAELSTAQVAKTKDAVAKAEVAAVNAVAASEQANLAAEEAQKEAYRVTELYDKAKAACKEEDDNFKSIKKSAERAAWTLDDSKKLETKLAAEVGAASLMRACPRSEAQRAYDAHARGSPGVVCVCVRVCVASMPPSWPACPTLDLAVPRLRPEPRPTRRWPCGANDCACRLSGTRPHPPSTLIPSPPSHPSAPRPPPAPPSHTHTQPSLLRSNPVCRLPRTRPT